MRKLNPLRDFLIVIGVIVLLTGCGPLQDRLAIGTQIAGGMGSQNTDAGDVEDLSPEEFSTALAETLAVMFTDTPQGGVVPTATLEPDGAGTSSPDGTEAEEYTPTVPGYQLTALAQTLTSIVTTPETSGTHDPNESAGSSEDDGTTTPTATLEPIEENPCNSFRFVVDISYPPGSIVQPNTYFYKGWYVQNTGECAWNAAYTLVLYDGFQLGGTNPMVLGNVAPGQYTEIWQTFYTPPQPGVYYSYWLIRDPAGNLFGGGENGDEPLVVEIVVPGDVVPTYPGPVVTAPPFTPGP